MRIRSDNLKIEWECARDDAHAASLIFFEPVTLRLSLPAPRSNSGKLPANLIGTTLLLIQKLRISRLFKRILKMINYYTDIRKAHLVLCSPFSIPV